MSRYDTNLAAEFHVLSCLHRRGLTANLTLAGDAVTVEVKGIAKKYNWPADNLVTQNPQRHFVALVSFEGHIDDPTMPAPRVWIIPFPQIEAFKRAYQTRANVSRADVLAKGGEFENAWHLIEGTTWQPVKYKISGVVFLWRRGGQENTTKIFPW